MENKNTSRVVIGVLVVLVVLLGGYIAVSGAAWGAAVFSLLFTASCCSQLLHSFIPVKSAYAAAANAGGLNALMIPLL